jgi:hypothetical protein
MKVTGEWKQLHNEELHNLSSPDLLTPWCKILFEKLIVIQLIKKYPAFLWNPKVHYRVHTIPPLNPILSQLNPVRPIDPYLPNVHLNGSNVGKVDEVAGTCTPHGGKRKRLQIIRNNSKNVYRRGCEDNIKMNIRQIGCEAVY